tara:strand:+ start:437 stop:598 length:162 start_codon:yes stop_codon:yes gene_type:complete
MIHFYGADYDDNEKKKKIEFGGVERNRDLENKKDKTELKKKVNKKNNKKKNKK